MEKKLIAILGALSLIGSHCAMASEVSPAAAIIRTSENKLEGLDAMINKALKFFQVPGVAVGIIIDGKVVLTKGYGFRDQAKGLSVTENTLFAIGSCTKAFTSHVLGQLADEGKISWDDPVVKYLPEFRLKDEYATYHVTIRDLVTHQSGLPRHDLIWYNSTLPRKDLLSRLPYLELSSDLRGKFQYNNLMYVIAGLLIERVTGDSWEEAVQSRVLSPLGMVRSNFSVLDSQKSNDFALPYRQKNGLIQSIPFNNITTVGPAGSINSNIVDMMKWVRFQLSEGTFEGQHLLEKETLRAMHTPQVAFRKFPEEASDFFGYSLGWFAGLHEGRYYLSHGGMVDGFISSAGFLPKEKIGVVVLTNSDSSTLFGNSLAEAILNQALGIEKGDWILKTKEKEDKIKSVPKEEKINEPFWSDAGARPFTDYIGEFEHPGYGTISVDAEESGLVVSYHALAFPLSHTCYDHFTGVWQWAWDLNFSCSFIRDRFGEVSELHMPMEESVDMIVFKRKAGNELLATNYLKQFEGLFESDLFFLNIVLKGTQLVGVIPSTGDEYALIPGKPLQFSIQGMPGATARFISAEDGKITAIVVNTSHGTFHFKVK